MRNYAPKSFVLSNKRLTRGEALERSRAIGRIIRSLRTCEVGVQLDAYELADAFDNKLRQVQRIYRIKNREIGGL